MAVIEDSDTTDGIEYTPRSERRRQRFPLSQVLLQSESKLRRVITLPSVLTLFLVAGFMLFAATDVAPGNRGIFSSPGTAEAATQITVDFLEGEHAPANSGNWVTGNLGSYPEGGTIRFRLVLTTTDGPASGTLTIGYTSESDCRFFTYALPTNVSITGGGSVSVGGLAQSGDDAQATFTITNLQTGSPQYLYFTLRLSPNAADCGSGSSQHVEIDTTSGNVKSAGAKTLPMPIQDVIPITDITVQKTGSATVSIGGNIQYTVTVTNLDAVTDADAVVITDTLPAGITFTTGTWTRTAPAGNGNCTAVAQVVTCNVGTLAGGATATATINGTVANNPALCGTTLTNNVSVSTTTQESNNNNNSATFNTTVNNCAASTFTVNKVYSSGAGGPVTITLDCNGNGVIAPATDTADTGDPAVFSVTGMTAAETCTAVESNVPAGYQQTATTCGAPGVNLPANGGSASCTITNAQNSATFMVNKVYVGGDGPAVSISLTCGTGTVTNSPQNADHVPDTDAVFTVVGITAPSTTCTASEGTPPTGYAQTGSDCTNVTLNANGGSASCTITNSKLPTISVQKICVPANATQTFVVSGAGSITSIDCGETDGPISVNPGNYNITETQVTGWDTPQYSGCADSDLTYGESLTCVITNNRLPTLTVDKVCVGATEGSFSISTTGTLAGLPASITCGPVVGPLTVDDGTTYNITETMPAGWQAGSPQYSTDCSGTLNYGEDVTCTITNVKLGALEVTKSCDPAEIEDQAFTFNLAKASAPNTTLDSKTVDCDTTAPDGATNPSVATFSNLAPDTYVVTEATANGYTTDVSDCASEEVAAGQTASCTIRNTLNSASVTVNKTNIDGTTTPDVNFTLSCTGGTVAPTGTQAVTPGDVQGADWDVTGMTAAGADCDLTESVPTNYKMGPPFCLYAGGAFVDTTGITNGVSFMVFDGDEITCTFRNVLKQGTVTIIKDVLGGTDAQDFNFDYSGTLESGDFELDDDGDNANTLSNTEVLTLLPGTYDITEDAVTGWLLEGNIVCSGTDSEQQIAGGVTVTVADLSDITCTFVNNKQEATLTVVKVALPDDGTDFEFDINLNLHNFTLDDAGVDDGDAFDDSESFTVLPGDYEIIETVVNGWSLTSVVCTVNGQGIEEDLTTGGIENLTLADGDSATCTFTNTLNSAKLTVNKNWSDDNTDAVTVTVACTAQNGTVVAPNPKEVTEVAPGVFVITGIETSTTCTATEDLTDSDLDGYTANQTNCAAVVVGENQQNATCTITNTLNTATITVEKDFTDDNTASVDINLVCSSGTIVGGGAGSITELLTKTYTVNGFTPGATCTATETVPAGYTAAQDDCEEVPLVLNDNVSCEIVNRLKTDSFTVVKDYVGGGTEPQVSVTLSCASGTVTNSPQPADEGLNAVFTVNGFDGNPTCTATETAVPAGYTSTGTCQADLETGTCTITNTLKTDSFTVVKDYVGGGTEPQVSVTLSCTSGNVTNSPQPADEGLNAVFNVQEFTGNPTCTATETAVPAGYTSTGTCQADLETGICTITNTLNSAKFTVNKDFSDDNTAAVIVTVTCTADNGDVVAPNPKNVTEVAPGEFVITGIDTSTTCTATEDLSLVDNMDDYDADESDCVNVQISANQQDAECTLVNELHGRITVVKDCDPETALVLTEDFEFSISGDPIDSPESGDMDCGGSYGPYYLPEGEYTVSETLNGSQYVQGSIVCSGADGADGDTVDLENGDVVTCTITNVPFGRVIVSKTCDPAGPENTDTFVITLTPTSPAGSPIVANPAESCDPASTTVFLVPAGEYKVSEADSAGNVYDYLSVVFSGDCDSDGDVTVQAGQTENCAVLNSALFDITVLKACGEEATAEALASNVTFTFSLFEGADVEPIESISGIECGEIVTFDDIPAVENGSYYVVEKLDELPVGWSQLGNTCEDLVATNMPSEGEGDQERNCTITNGFADPAVGKVVEEEHENIVMAGHIPTVQAGLEFQYIIRVINQGDATGDFLLEDYDLTNATIMTVLESYDNVTCVFLAGETNFDCDVTDLPAGEFVDIVVVVQANDTCDPISNFARVSYLTEVQEEVGLAVFPPDFDGFADDVQAVQVNVFGCDIDLDVTKGQRLGDNGGFTTTTLQVEPGDTVQYRLTIRNDGDVVLTDVELEDPISNDLTLTDIVSDPDNRCDIVAGDLVCDGFDLDPGESYTVIIEVEVDDCDLITNRGFGDAIELGVQQSNAVQLECEIEEEEQPQQPTPTQTPVNQVQGTTTQPQQPQPRISEVLPTRLPVTGTGDSLESGSGFADYAVWGGIAVVLALLGLALAGRKLLARQR